MSELKTSVVIDLAGNLAQRAQRYGRALTGFSDRGQRDLSRLSRTATTLGNNLDRLAGRTSAVIIGAGTAYAAARQVMDSAQLDKKLILVQQTAGATKEQAAALRNELFLMAAQTGQSIDSLLNGFGSLVQSGQSWASSLATLKAINPAMAVTASRAEDLSSALTVASEAYDFDLSNIQTATDLLDMMANAASLGQLELEDLSSTFSRTAVNANSAGFGIEQLLGMTEVMSYTEANPERLATLVDSTMRIFTNQKYLEGAQAATGVNFYDASGTRRNPLDVLSDIAVKYQQLGADVDRDKALSAAFGNVDLDTMRGLRVLLSKGTLDDVKTFSDQIKESSGYIENKLPEAIDNSVVQANRLKSVLKEAADGFAQPINETITDVIQYLLDDKNLTGGELLAGGAAGLLGGALLLKGGGKLLKSVGGLGAGVATGKALEQVGVQPVYVVNMPGGGMGGLADAVGGGKGAGRFGRMGAGLASAGRFALTRATPLAAAGAGGYLIGDKLINPMIDGTAFGNGVGKFTASILASLGNNEARAALDADPDSDYTPGGNRRQRRSSSHIKVEVSDERVSVKSVRSDGMDLDVSGSSMVMP